jgi:hypothetical protein
MLWRSFGFDFAAATNCGEGGAASRETRPGWMIVSEDVLQLVAITAVMTATVRDKKGNLMRTKV